MNWDMTKVGNGCQKSRMNAKSRYKATVIVIAGMLNSAFETFFGL